MRPPSIAYFVLALTIQYWMTPAVYLLLKTYLIAPNGFFVWLAMLAAATAFFGGMGLFLVQAVKTLPIARAARSCRLSGDEAGFQRHMELFRASRKAIRHRPMWIAMLSMFVFIPASVAFVLSAGQPVLLKDHGKLRFGTRQEEIRAMLHRIEQHGVFRPLDFN